MKKILLRASLAAVLLFGLQVAVALTPIPDGSDDPRFTNVQSVSAPFQVTTGSSNLSTGTKAPNHDFGSGSASGSTSGDVPRVPAPGAAMLAMIGLVAMRRAARHL